MSTLKSFSFPNGDIRGDMFYIKHNSENFTIIDCYLKDGDDENCRKDEIIQEIVSESRGRITRFISTHPFMGHLSLLGLGTLSKYAESKQLSYCSTKYDEYKRKYATNFKSQHRKLKRFEGGS